LAILDSTRDVESCSSDQQAAERTAVRNDPVLVSIVFACLVPTRSPPNELTSSSISPPSASQRLPLQYQGVERTSDHGDGLMHDSPSRAPTGLPTPGFPSSFSSLHSLNSAPALSSSSSQSQFNTSPGSATSNKFERAFAMSPHKFDDTHLFEPFGISPPNHDYTRSYGGRLSQGSLQLSSSIETVRPRASSVVIPPAPDLSYKLGGLNLGRNGSNARSVHPFGNAFSPLPSAHHKPESRK